MRTTNINIYFATHCHFGGTPKAPPIVKPPLPVAAANDVNASMGSARKRQGGASTILTSGQGVENQTSKKTILGG